MWTLSIGRTLMWTTLKKIWLMWTPLKYFGQCGPHWNILVNVDWIKIGRCGQSKIYIKYNYLQFIKLGCCGQHNDYLVIVDNIKKSHCGHYKKKSLWTTLLLLVIVDSIIKKVIVDHFNKKSLWTTLIKSHCGQLLKK